MQCGLRCSILVAELPSQVRPSAAYESRESTMGHAAATNGVHHESLHLESSDDSHNGQRLSMIFDMVGIVLAPLVQYGACDLPPWHPATTSMSDRGVHDEGPVPRRCLATMGDGSMPLPAVSTPALRRVATVLSTTLKSTPSVWVGNLTVFSHSLASSSE